MACRKLPYLSRSVLNRRATFGLGAWSHPQIINQAQHPNQFAAIMELPGHFESHQASKGESQEMVGPARVHRLNRLDVVRRQLLYAQQGGRLTEERLRSYTVNRLVGLHVPHQIPEWS
jgi:hypothetical protein